MLSVVPHKNPSSTEALLGPLAGRAFFCFGGCYTDGYRQRKLMPVKCTAHVFLFAVVILRGCLASAQKTSDDGNFLLSACRQNVIKQDNPDAATNLQLSAYCSGVVRGVSAVADSLGAINLPESSTLGQAVRVSTMEKIDRTLAD